MPDLAPLGPGRFSNAQLLAIWSQTWPQWNCWRFSQSQLVLWREDPRIWNWGRYHPSKSGLLGGKPPDMELRELASSHRGFSLPLNSIGSGGSVLQLVLWDLLYCLGIIADYSSVGPEGTSWPLPDLHPPGPKGIRSSSLITNVSRFSDLDQRNFTLIICVSSYSSKGWVWREKF